MNNVLKRRKCIKYNIQLFEHYVAAIKFQTTIGLVYAIYCKSTDRSYVGKTKVCGCRPKTLPTINRFTSHYSQLQNKKHPVKELQEHWNKYGEANFEFEVIETMVMNSRIDDVVLSQHEAWWIENLPNLYNVCHRSQVRYIGGHPDGVSILHLDSREFRDIDV